MSDKTAIQLITDHITLIRYRMNADREHLENAKADIDRLETRLEEDMHQVADLEATLSRLQLAEEDAEAGS